MTYLTASEAKTTKQQTYRYLVELVSNQLDYKGVPESHKIVDVVVLENTLEAIKAVIAAANWLSDCIIVSYWLPSDSAEF